MLGTYRTVYNRQVPHNHINKHDPICELSMVVLSFLSYTGMSRSVLKSPFLNISNAQTGYHPTDAEAVQIRSIISDSLAERLRIDQEISMVEASIQELRQRRLQVDEFLNAHRALAPPIHRLPTELLLKIFYFCLVHEHSAMTAHEAPILLGRICRTWRNVAYSAPKLWNSIHVYATSYLGSGITDQDINESKYCKAVRDWLVRSGDLPLSISYIDDRTSWDLPPGVIKRRSRLLETLVEFCFRWKNVYVKAAYDLTSCLTDLRPSDTPLLSIFGIEITQRPPDGAIENTISFLKSSSLQEISLYCFTVLRPSELPLPWINITKLFFGSSETSSSSYLTLKESELILRMCNNLVACTLEATIEDDVPWGGDQFVVPSLDHLGMHFIYWGNAIQNVHNTVSHFFELLHVPKLKSLKVTGASNFSNLPFLPLLQRYPGRLESLVFDTISACADGIDRLCPLLTAVKKLHINAYVSPTAQAGATVANPIALNKAVFERLTPRLNKFNTPLPLLEDLHFFMAHDCDVSDDTILQFILRRTSFAPDGVSRLKSAVFIFDRTIERDILSDLQHVIRAGTRVTLDYLPMRFHQNEHIFQPLCHLEVAEGMRDNWRTGF